MGESFEWVEIIEPSRKEHMFANLKTGQCLWDPPDGVSVKPTHENQWWELYDTNTRRYYYYNAASQRTVWRQPKDGDIIPLAKLQMLKAKEIAQKNNSNFEVGVKQDAVKNASLENEKHSVITKTSHIEKKAPPPAVKRKSLEKLAENSASNKESSRKDSIEKMDVVHTPRDNTLATDIITGSENSEQSDVDVVKNQDDEPVYENYDPSEQVYENFNPSLSKDENMSMNASSEVDKLEAEELEAVYENIVNKTHPMVVDNTQDELETHFSLRTGVFMQTNRNNSKHPPLCAEVFNSSTLPRTSPFENNSERLKFNSLRSKAPPKPPRTSMIERNDSFQVVIERSSKWSNQDTDNRATSSSNEITSSESNLSMDNSVAGSSVSFESCPVPAPRPFSKPIRAAPSALVMNDASESNAMEIARLSDSPSPSSPQLCNAPLSPYNSHQQDSGVQIIPVAPPLPPQMERPLPDPVEQLRDSSSMYDNFSDSKDTNETGPTDDNVTPSGTLLRSDNVPTGRSSYYERFNNEEDALPVRTSSPVSPRQLPVTPEAGRSTPVKRSPVTRIKSDSSEKRPKVSKTSEITQQFRPVSMLNLSSAPQMKPRRLGSDSDISEHVPLTTHRKGIFRRRMSINSMLSWSKTPLKKPLVLTSDKQLRKESVEVFKLILQYMGDKSSRKSQDVLSVEITTKGWSNAKLRDEIYIQLCKQTTKNEKSQSLRRGWELITACLTMFPPSIKFHSYLEGYIYRNMDPASLNTQVEMYAKYCYKQLDRICQVGAKRGLKGPTVEEIHASVKRVFNPSMFGNSLEDIMEMQAERFPDNRLPWILTTLTDSVLLHNGLQTEGIFRVPGDIDEVNSLKLEIDKWQLPPKINEPHVPASLLKLWFRDLYEPLIPQRFYDQCVHNCDNREVCLHIVTSLPPLNNLVFSYLIRLLQAFMIPENVFVSKMDENNLAMVWAPNCLRCPSDDPREIFENTRKEMTFLRTVMKYLDTSFLEGIV